MQGVQLVLLAGGLTLGAAWLATRFAHHPRADQGWPAALLLGIVAGVVGVVAVAVLAFDSVPDDLEGGIRVAGIVGVSAVAILGSIYRFTHR